MDRQLLQEHLARAERRISESDILVERQRLLVDQLINQGHAEMARSAVEILAGFERILAARRALRHSILEELAENSN